MEKERIIALIAEDIKHNSLINGLQEIGLTDNDNYLLRIDVMVAGLMGHVNVPDKWIETYHKTMLFVPNNLTHKEAHNQAIKLFESLSSVKD